MKKRKIQILIASLLVVLAGVTIVWAYFNASDSANNFFTLGNKYTLTYHANTGSDTEDDKVTVPATQTAFGNGTDPVDFTVSTDVPTRQGFVFKGWYESKTPDADAIRYGDGGEPTYKAPATQKESHLYAKWIAGYTLIYDPNGGKGTPDITGGSGEVVSENKVTKETGENTYTFANIATQGNMTGPEHKDPDDPEKTSSSNRIFLGWSTDKNATEPEYTQDGNLAYANTANDYDGNKTSGFKTGVEIDSTANPSRTVTLYAVWATKYELRFSYHPDMLDPKTGDPSKLQDPMTLVSATKKAHTFTLITQVEADAAGYTPTREEGYRWGWWGDNLERFKFNKPGENQTAAQAGNEGCYQFGEPVPSRTGTDTSKSPNYNDPVLTLYAYFQPPSACSVAFDDNTSNTKQFPIYADRNNTYKVDKMPDNMKASFTQIEWRPEIPSGEDNTPVHPRYQFLGWSEDMNSTNPEFQPGDKLYVNKVLNNSITLYAIWKPMHNFRLTFNRGYKTPSGGVVTTGTNEYYVQTSSRQWKRGPYNIWFDSNMSEYEQATSTYFTETSYTWAEGFFKKRGFFATKDDDTVGTYKFLGWSWEPQIPSTDEEALMQTVAFTVNLPDDPNSILDKSPGDDNTIGVIEDAITVNEVAPCTQPTRHDFTLYAVYRKSPKHQLRVVFDKGNATKVNCKGTDTSGSDVHYIDINGVTQNKDSYYASMDHSSYTWDASYWSTKTPTAEKNAETDGTATYTFLGWTTDQNQKTPSTTITKADIDYPVDDDGKITKAITVKETETEAKDCKGGIHEIKLYPVFRKNLFHIYQLNYDVNAPSTADGIVTKLYRNETGTWNNVQVFPDPDTMVPPPDPKPEKGDAAGTLYSETKELSVTSYTWNMSGKGLFATCENTGSSLTGKMTLIGWSNKRFKPGEYDSADPPSDTSIRFYPITVPDDPSDPQNAGVFADGTSITIDVDEQDPKPSDACTDDKGKIHKETLYGVWTAEPIHQYSVIFAANSDKPAEDDVEVVYGKKSDWESGNPGNLGRSKETIKKTYKKYDEDIPVTYYDAVSDTETALTKDLKNTYRVFSEPLALPDDPNKTDSYQFDASFWNNDSDPDNVKDLIVRAEKKPTADTRYVFDGWNTKADGTGTDIAVDGDGYITDTLEIKDTDYDNCDSYTHNLILYAKWKTVRIHNFQLIFYGYNANSLGYMDGATWRSGSYVKNYKNYIDKNTITDITLPSVVPRYMYYASQNVTDKYDSEGSGKKTSYSWGQNADSGEQLRVMAAKNREANYEYEFLGWSKTIVDPSEKNTANDADYHVDSSGYIEEVIEIEEPDDPCEKSTHTMVLYPVFKKIPIHNFSVTLNTNGGNGLRAYNANNNTWSSSTTYTYNYPNSNGAKARVTENSHTWTVDDFWSKRGFSAYRNQDSDYTYEFVGWSTTVVEPSENPSMDNAIAWTEHSRTPSTSSRHPNEYVNGFINQDITKSCGVDPCEGGEHNVTLYAVWKRAPRTKNYTLKFDANGGDNAPAAITQSETYNGSSWLGYSEFTLTNAQITESGMKNKRKVFVGWHENKNADQGKYGEINDSNDELAQLTQTLTNPYRLTGTAYTNEKTLYAVWWYEFNLIYDANGGSNAPEHEHAYTKDPNFLFEISKDAPTHSEGYTFLGWSQTQTTPGQGTAADVQIHPSTADNKVDWNVTADGDPSSDDYGYTEKKLYAVWGPAN